MVLFCSLFANIFLVATLYLFINWYLLFSYWLFIQLFGISTFVGAHLYISDASKSIIWKGIINVVLQAL